MKRFVLIAMSIMLAMSAPAFAGEFTQVDNLKDLFGKWDKKVQLYVQGDVGLDKRALSQIADDLTKHPSWTVVLWGNASGESYTDGDGRRHTGYEAVEFGVGQGLRNTGPFVAQTDGETNLGNGAVLVICFNPRQVAYYSSPLQDGYGLNHKKVWKGNYDQYAISALKSRNVRQGVNTPIQALDSALDSKRQAEKSLLAQQESSAQAAVASAEKSLESAKLRAGQFAQKWPEAQGDLRRANFVGQEGLISQAKQALEAKQWSEAQSLSRQVQTAAEQLIHAYDEHGNAETTLGSLEAKANSLAQNSFTETSALEKAKAKIAEAKAAWQHADSNYLGLTNESQRLITKVGDSAVAAEAHAKSVRRIKLFSEVGLVLLILSVLVIARRRRNLAAQEVLELLAAWQKGVEEKAAALLKLDERRRRLLGVKPEDVAFSGETKEAADQVIEAMGYLFILHSCAMEVVRQVKERVGAGGLRYHLSTAPFADAARLMTGAPVKFRPQTGIEFVLNGRKAAPEEVLWAPLKSFKPFEMSMEQLQEQFAKRAKTATELLQQLQEAIDTSKGLGEGVKQRIDALDYTAGQADDQKLRIPPSVQAKLQPALEAALAAANSQRLLDPLAAFNALCELDKWLITAEQVVGDIQQGVTTGLPALQGALDMLGQAGVPVKRFDTAQKGILINADKVVVALAGNDCSVRDYSFSGEVEKLCGDARQAADTEKKRQGLKGSLATVVAKIAAARAEISTLVNVPAENLLQEKEANPNDVIAKIDELLGAASTQIGQLKLDDAASLLEQVEDQLAEAEKLVADSLAAAKAFTRARQGLVKDAEKLSAAAEKVSAVLDEIVANYAAEVALLGEGDSSHPNANGTIGDNLEEVAATVSRRDRDLAKADDLYAKGSVLYAMKALALVNAHHEFIKARLDEVTEKRERLTKAEKQNAAEVRKLETDVSKLEDACKDDVASEETMGFATKARKALDAASGGSKNKPNPFAVGAKLAEAKSALGAGTQALDRDSRLSRKVQNALAEIGRTLGEIDRDYKAATSDDIPDSDALKVSGRKIPALVKKVENFKVPKHPNWVVLDHDLSELTSAARNLLAEIRQEQEEAEEAQKRMNSANKAIRRAKSWSGSYGVTIRSQTGGSVMREAEAAFVAGNYALALDRAARAESLAQSAIDDAENRVEDARREIERQEEEDRRRRRAEEERRSSYESSHHSSSYSSGWSSSSDSGSSSWSSFDSGGSSSGFSSGDPGGSSSAW